MWKECKIITLATKDNVGSITKNDKKYYNNKIITPKYIDHYHLYILSDDEIKEEDYIYQSLDKYISKVDCFKIEYKELIQRPKNDYYGYNKIIASTDKSLNLPIIPDEFIEEWCNNPIDKILVEYKEYMECSICKAKHNIGYSNCRAIRTTDNELCGTPLEYKTELVLYNKTNTKINIKFKKEFYTYAQVIEIINKYRKDVIDNNNLYKSYHDIWIKENL